jgi:hypothetical protein
MLILYFLGKYEWTKLSGLKLVLFQDSENREKIFAYHDTNIPVVDASWVGTLVGGLQWRYLI